MSSDAAVKLRGVGKVFPIYAKPHHRLLEMLSEMENSCIRLSQISDGTAVGSAFPRGAALAGFGCGAGAGVAAGRACCMLAAMRLTGWVS